LRLVVMRVSRSSNAVKHEKGDRSSEAIGAMMGVFERGPMRRGLSDKWDLGSTLPPLLDGFETPARD
jgi:hypothetical protein